MRFLRDADEMKIKNIGDTHEPSGTCDLPNSVQEKRRTFHT